MNAPQANTETHTLLFRDASLNRKSKATLVTQGGGQGWMLHPWPTDPRLGGDCDYVVAPGQ